MIARDQATSAGSARNGFVKVPYALLRHPSLSSSATVLAAILLGYARDKSSAYPSELTLAQWLGVTAKTIQRAVSELEAAGLVTVTRRGNHGRGNVYDLSALKCL